MTKRTILALGLVVCACVCWAFTNAAADQSVVTTASGKKTLLSTSGIPRANKPQISEEQQLINERPIDKRDRSFLTHSRPRDASDILPTWPAVPPLSTRERAAADPRSFGPPHCTFEPCQTLIYENTGGNSIGSFGDADNVPLCDDLNLVAAETDRFVCSVNVSIGGVAGTSESATVTLSLRSGNFFPICPDDPASTVIYCTTRNFLTTNPPTLLTVDINPPILVDANFLWICLQSTNLDAAWSISADAEGGSFTEDDIVIPNSNRGAWANCATARPQDFCEDLGPGQADDYFYYGGPPTIAGMYVEIFANPGPPGACCDRDQNPATCTDSVSRGNCLTGPTKAWKEGLCAAFDDTTPHCATCISDATCISGATVSSEPNCSPGYVDTTNAGCESSPNAFESISCGQSICGTSGTHQSSCVTEADCAPGVLCTGNICAGADDSRDTDWYELVLTATQQVTVLVEARFDAEMALIDNGGDPTHCTDALLNFVQGKACDVLSITRCLPAGSWWIRVRPNSFSGLACSTRYRITVNCANCSLPTGACCDASPAGCSILAQVACGGADCGGGAPCGGQGGQYRGDGTVCATAGCPGVPSNDSCESKISLTALAIMKTFDTSFASDTDLLPSGQDVIPNCDFGTPPGADPAGAVIRQDIFYNYKIPTVYSGVTVTSGKLVISTIGSSIDTFVVIYGDTGATGGTQPCGSALCAESQIFCNDNRIDDGTAFRRNTLSHLELDVQAGSTDFFDPGDCIKIRVGRGRRPVLPSRPLGGPGLVNIDFVPTAPSPYIGGAAGTGRCCFYDEGTQTVGCTIAITETACNAAGGKYRQFTDFNQGDPFGFEDYAGCKSDPCPQKGDACYTALDLNAEFGGNSGMVTRNRQHILWCKYRIPSGVNGIVLDTCGMGPGALYNSFTNPIIGVYTYPLIGTSTGDCDLGTLLAINDDCSVTESSSIPAMQVAACFGGVNNTSDACLCLGVNGAGGPQSGDYIYIAVGCSNVAGGQFEFEGSPRDIVIPVTDPLDITRPTIAVLQVTTVAACLTCDTACPGGSIAEGEAICEDTNNPGTVDAIGPQDLYNGGCNSTPPAFNGPIVACSTTPVRICGKAGNFTNPYPCDAPADCPATEPCTGTGGSCVGPIYINRDTDWYKITVPTASTISWRVASSEFAPEIGILGDPLGDCNATTVAFDALDFPCEPPTGTPNSLEVTAAVCAGTYYLYIAPNVFGGIGDTECDSDYVVEASCQPFVQLAECCIGDMNNDGKVNGGDIRKWIDTLFFPPTLFDDFQGCFAANFCRADVTGNGLIDVAGDLPAFVNLLVQSNKPICPTAAADCFDPAYGQPPGILETGEVGCVKSDLDLNLDDRAADCFCPAESGVISRLCWWGTYLDFAGLECGPEPDCFKVTFYNNNNGAGRCPGTVIDPPGYQFVESATAAVVRTATAGLIAPTGTPAGGTATEYMYTATLPIPLTVTAGQCLWIEIVNDSPLSNCQWQWETSPNGDTVHAQIDVTPATGALPTVYAACATPANVAAIDMAFSVGVRIDKEGCGKPPGRCCYDAAPLGVIDCIVTALDRCQAIFFGEWVEGGSCPPSPACTLGRCCYADLANAPQCVITMKSTCDNLDQTSPQISTRPGLWTAAIADCSGGNACPTGRCCVYPPLPDPPVCTAGVTEAVCLAQGGAWLSGGNCAGTPPCPSAICDVNTRCQTAHVVSNVQQGGYVSDADNTSLVADDFRPSGNGTINQICWRGFHSINGCDGGVGSAETFNVKFYKAVAGNSLPDLTQVVGTYTGQTPTKSIPVPSEASPAPLNSQQYKYQLSLSPTLAVSAGQCYWLEIQNTTVASSCVWVWATAAPSDSPNRRAAVRKTGTGAFAYQGLDRDLAYCVGPVVIGATACSYTPPAPSNNACSAAITILSGTANALVGTTIGATMDGSELTNAACTFNSAANGGDVWYRYTSNAFDQTLTVSTCGVRTSFDSMVSIHKTMPDVPVECPGSSSTIVLVGQSCDDEGCTSGLGTQQLFFPNRQGRRVASVNAIDPNKTYLIRVTGKDSVAHSGGSKGVFSITVTQP